MFSYQFSVFLSFVSIFCIISMETLTSSSSSSIELLNEQQSTDITSTSARSRSFQRQQSVYNNGNNLNHNNKLSFGLHNNLPSGCCSCSECCSCDSGSDYPEIYDDSSSQQQSSSSPQSPSSSSSSSINNLQGNPISFNRFGQSTTRRSVIVRRRYVRPNGGITVVEVEETPNSPPPPPSPLTFSFGNLNRLTGGGGGGGLGGGSSLFGGGQNLPGGNLFSRFIPSALERYNSTRKRAVTSRANQPVLVTINNSLTTINSTRLNNKLGNNHFNNNNQRRKN